MSGLSRRHLLGTALAGSAVTFSGVAAAKIENPCKLPQKWDETHKVVIVGSGGAGLAVAVSAAQNGVKDIVVLEKMSYIGGNTAISGGAFNTTDHKRQPKQGIKDSPELHAEQTLKGGDYRANPALVHKMTENSEAALNWLEEMGVAFKPDVYQVYGALYPRSHDAVHSLGSDYIKVLKAQCDKLGIKIFTNSRVTGIIREQPLSGRVLGVEFENSKKEKKYWKADVVVVCAGGFGANPQMRAKYDPRMLNLTTTNHVGATGDLIPLMQDIGADVIGMDHIQCNPGCPPGRKQRIVLHMHVEHLVMVDRKGQRFVPEDSRRDVIREAILSLPDQTAFSIIDSDGYAALNPGHVAGLKKGLETGDAWTADTIEELAKKIKVDPAALKKTIDEFNAGVDAKQDKLGKAARNLTKIDKPPFWAGYSGMSVHHTMGGVRINLDNQVLDRYDQVIPGLFAVGEVTGGIHGSNRLGGNAICDIFTFGRLTGIYLGKHLK